MLKIKLEYTTSSAQVGSSLLNTRRVLMYADQGLPSARSVFIGVSSKDSAVEYEQGEMVDWIV